MKVLNNRKFLKIRQIRRLGLSMDLGGLYQGLPRVGLLAACTSPCCVLIKEKIRRIFLNILVSS